MGGFYGAKLARAGHDVTFLARGAHLQALRERGLEVRGVDGTFVVKARAEEDAARAEPVDVVLLTVKTYDNVTALPMVRTLVAASPGAMVLPLQNGVETADALAAEVGQGPVLGGITYILTSLTEPGVITQTGATQRIVFGEWFGDTSRVSPRASALHAALTGAGLHAEVVPDARVPTWDKFVFLAVYSGFTAAARSPIGPLWSDPHVRGTYQQALDEMLALARAEGVAVTETRASLERFMESLPPTGRSSLLFDLEQGKPLEVEALQGAVVRRARAHGLPTPVMSTLYAVLRPHAQGRPRVRGG